MCDGAAAATAATAATASPHWRWGGGYELAIRLAKQACAECYDNPESRRFWLEYLSRLFRARVLPFLPGRTLEPATLVPLRFVDDWSGAASFPATRYASEFYVCLEDHCRVVKAHLAEMRTDLWHDCREFHVAPSLSWAHKGRILRADASLASQGVRPGDTLVAAPHQEGG